MKLMQFCLILALGTFVTCGCSKSKKAANEAKESKNGRDTNNAKLKQAVIDALETQPTSSDLSIVPLDVEKDNPIDAIRIELIYEGEKALGYKRLKIESMHQVGKKRNPKTIIMASYPKGEEELKIIVLGFDPDGKIIDNRRFEEDKQKVAAVEKRCLDIKKAIDKHCPKEPSPRK